MKKSVTTILLLALIVNANAQEKEREIKEVVVFGTPTQPTKRVGEALYTGVEISKKGLDVVSPSGNLSINSILNIVPSISVQNQDPYGFGESNMRIRGIRNSYSGMTTEGIPNYGGAPIGAREYIYEPENLEKIAIYKGAVPSDIVSASGNRGGSIDLKFKRPKDVFGADITQSFGSNSYSRTYLRVDTGKLPTGTKLFASYSYSEADKWRGRGIAGRKNHVDIGLVQDVTSKLKLEAFFIYNELFRHNYKTYTLDQIHNYKDNYKLDYNNVLFGQKEKDIYYYDYNRRSQTNKLLITNLYYKFSDNNKLSFKYYYNEESGEIFSGVTTKGKKKNYYLNEDVRNSTRHGIVLNWSGKHKNFEYSTGYWFEISPKIVGGHVLNRDVLTMKLATNTANFTSQSEGDNFVHNPFIKLAYHIGNLRFQAGLRYMYNSSAPNNVYKILSGDPLVLNNEIENDMSLNRVSQKVLLPTFGIGYRFNKFVETYLNYGRNYMRPYAYRPLFNAYQNNRDAFLALGKTYQSLIDDYSFETSDNFDLGILFNTKNIKVNANAFYSKQKNVLQNVVSPYYPTIKASYNQNVGELTAYGAELETYFMPIKNMTIFFHPSYNRMSFDKNLELVVSGKKTVFELKGKQSPSVPMWMMKTGLMYKLKDLSFNTILTYTGDRYADALGKFKVPSNTVIDASLNYELKDISFVKKMIFGIELKNILNTKYISMINTSDFSQNGEPTFNVGFPRTFVATMSLDF